MDPIMNLWEIYHGDIPGFLREAAETKAMQRLNHVGMNCGCEYTSFPQFQNCGPYSRFDHSMGTALIVWHFTEDRTQAMAGLLHDIATPVFAHVIDFFHGDHMKQESTEEGTRSLIAGSEELQQILTDCGLTTDAVCDYHRYPVADNDSPKLSADRLEYTLGNLVNYGFAARSQVRDYFQNLLARPNETGETELQFRDRETAFSFCRGMLQCARVYVSEEDRYAMEMLAELLRDAIHGGALAENDLYATEPQVIEKLKCSAEFARRWEWYCSLNQMLRAERPGKENGWRQIFAKKRYIDPLVLGEGRVSEISGEMKEKYTEFLEETQHVWLLGTSL